LLMMECIEPSICAGSLSHHLMIIFRDTNWKKWIKSIAASILLMSSYLTLVNFTSVRRP
jgi:hypothetical protein